MRRAFLIFLAMGIIFLGACTREGSPESSSTADNTFISDATSHPDASANNKQADRQLDLGISFAGGYDVLSRSYIDAVESIYLASLAVGIEAADKWTNDIYLKQTSDQQDALPALYQIIRDLSIAAEDLIAVSDKLRADGHEGMALDESVIKALYYEDENEIKQALASPLALYYQGKVYSFNELWALIQSEDEDKVRIPDSVISDYLNRAESLIKENVSEKIYETEYQQKLHIIQSYSAVSGEAFVRESESTEGLRELLEKISVPDMSMSILDSSEADQLEWLADIYQFELDTMASQTSRLTENDLQLVKIHLSQVFGPEESEFLLGGFYRYDEEQESWYVPDGHWFTYNHQWPSSHLIITGRSDANDFVKLKLKGVDDYGENEREIDYYLEIEHGRMILQERTYIQ